jgi:hypothetical protein
LNLPTDKSGGFQVPPRGGSRGRFPARDSACIALPPRAPGYHLPTCFPRDTDSRSRVMRFSSRWNTKEFLYWSGIAACPALAYAYTVTGRQQVLRLTRQAWQQMKHLSLSAFDILRAGLPSTTPYIKCQRAAQEYSSLFVTCTTSLCGLQPQQELLLRSNARLTPYLTKGGCACALLRAAGCHRTSCRIRKRISDPAFC